MPRTTTPSSPTLTAESGARARGRAWRVECVLPQLVQEASADDWLLWPVRVLRISLPVRERRALDLFERVALEIAVAGGLSRERIEEAAALLHLDRELLLHVAKHLASSRLLDGSFNATPKGEQVAASAWMEERRDALVWMYAAEWSGRVWPFTQAERTGSVTPRWHGSRQAELSLGSAGSGARRRGVVVPVESRLGEVASHEVRRALEERTTSDAADADPGAAVPDTARLGHLTMMAGEDSVYLAAPMWSIHDGEEDMICDPVTGRGSDELTLLVRELLERDHRLEERWARRHESEADEPVPVRPEDTAVAEQRLEREVGARLRQTEIWTRAVELERALLAVEFAGGVVRPERIRLVVTEAQAVVERLFQLLLHHFPSTEVEDRLARLAEGGKRDSRGMKNRRAFKVIAQRFGADVPYKIANQPLDLVARALNTGAESLRPLVAAALLGADMMSGHPLGEALRRAPDLLKRVDDLAESRNQSAHASERVEHVDDAHKAVASVREVLRVIQLPTVISATASRTPAHT